MSKNKNIEIEFIVTEKMVESFARLSGDYNSMHVNPEIARKSRYRQPVVHGMIPFSFIQFLGSEFKDNNIEFVSLNTRFRKPVFIDDEIILSIMFRNNEYEGVWKNKLNGETVITSKGTFKLSQNGESHSSKAESFLLDMLDETQYLIDDLEGRHAQFGFQAATQLKKEYISTIFTPGLKTQIASGEPGDNLVAVLMLSTLVGMQLPGRYATFTRFEVFFKNDVQPSEQYSLLGQVTKAKCATEIMEANIGIQNNQTIADGKIEVVLNPPPKEMLNIHELKKKHGYFNLESKVALITGASRGIGETTAKLFASLGAKVVINYYRGQGDAERIANEIKDIGGDAIAVQCDITNENSVRQMVATAIQQFEKIDILVNNAVKDFSPKNITDMNWEDFNQEMEVSVKGMHACCREIIPILKKNGGGKIINLSTVAVDNPVAGQSRYITAKSAVVGYTKSLGQELLKFNIQANLVITNMTDTDLVSVLPTMYKEKIADSRPYGRHVLPVEVAQSIAFLASNWSDAITGQKIVLNLGEPPFA